tara:strand:+ start:91 stop:549 length:459 start_codon:yes stop_codon:yes gene_type:complete
MPQSNYYGINFPFNESPLGFYLDLSDSPEAEIRSNLIHLLLTRKGSRYFLPDFGTRLYEYIFEPLDSFTFSDIEQEIKDSVKKYIPNLIINKITITSELEAEESEGTLVTTNDDRVYRVAGEGTEEHTAKVKLDFTIKNDVFETHDFIIINL